MDTRTHSAGRPSAGPPAIATRRRPATLLALAAIMGLLAVGAVQGGVAMVVNPLTPLGMTVEFLEGSPVHSYLWPGVFLLGIAFASLITATGLLAPWRWRWIRGLEVATGYRWPWVGAVAVGGVLLIFEIIELFLVPFHPVMHPLLIAVAALIVVLPLTPSVKAHLRA